MSHGSDDSDNYWPGYVDALTSMVQVLAFVMMMLAMAVFVLSQSVSKHAVEAIAKAVNADVKPNSDIKQMTQAVMDQLDRLRPSSKSDKPESPAETPPSKPTAANDTNPEKVVSMRVNGARGRIEQTPAQIPPNAPHMTVNFEDRSFRIDQERAQSLSKFVEDNKVAERKQTIIINAYAYSGDGALSEARRLAYYRAMMARKQLVDDKVRPDAIRINVNDTTDKDKGFTVEMIIADTGVR
jgi:hypothetical protein